MSKTININEVLRDEVETADRKFLANELVYLFTELDGITKQEALSQIIEMTDEDLVSQVNEYYEGTGTIYKMGK